MLAGRLVVPWAHASPRHQSAGRAKPAHVHANLGYHYFRRPKINPRDGVEEVNRPGERGDHRRYVVAQPLNGLIDVLQVCEQLADKQPGRWWGPAAERFSQRRQLLTQLALSQFG